MCVCVMCTCVMNGGAWASVCVRKWLSVSEGVSEC